MSDGLEGLGDTSTEEIADISISSNGTILPHKTKKVLLVDADTIIFTACLNSEMIDEVFPESFYHPEEWLEIINDHTYDAETGSRRLVFEDDIDAYVEDKLQTIMDLTGTSSYELHLTGGSRKSFRYTKLDPMYKATRKGGSAPAGLHEAKVRWVENNATNVFMWEDFEADDIVVALKRDNPNKYVLAAVDKDVLYSLPGKHFNYYTSAKHNIDMRWIEVDKLEAMKHHYIQTLTGDTADNVPGLVGIGPKKAAKILEGCEKPDCMWHAIVEAYELHGKNIIDALTTMRLVNMRQLFKNKNGDYKLELWKPLGVSYGTK